jgi:hypothetical protein
MPSSRATAVTGLLEESTSTIASRLTPRCTASCTCFPPGATSCGILEIPVSRCHDQGGPHVSTPRSCDKPGVQVKDVSGAERSMSWLTGYRRLNHRYETPPPPLPRHRPNRRHPPLLQASPAPRYIAHGPSQTLPSRLARLARAIPESPAAPGASAVTCSCLPRAGR